MRLFLAALCALLVIPACAGAVTVGKTNTTSTYSNSQVGTGSPQDYRFVAGTSGSVNRLNLYVASGSTAGTAKVGLYAGSSSSGGALLGACTIQPPVAAAWNSCAIPSVQVTAGSYYWLAILQPSGVSGTLYWREGVQSGGVSDAGPGGKTSLPATWVNGTTWSGYTASIYADETAPPPADTTPPDTIIDTPPVDTTDTSASIAFHSTETGSTFSCTLDGVQAGCSSPQAYSGLAVGAHTFTVAATDVAGNTDPTPASASWTVQDPPPPPPSSGFPDASNTGVPAGTSLTAYTGPNPVTANNTVIDSKTITGSLDIRATGVVVKNSMITGNIDTTQGAGSGAVTVQDTTIDCDRSVSSATGTALNGSHFTVLRANIYDCENGFYGGDSSITDSYMHDLYQCSSATACDSGDPSEPHTDGFQIDPAVNTTIQHNTIEGWTDPCRDGSTFSLLNGACNGTSAVIMCQNSGCAAPHDVIVTQNLLSGGAYTLGCPSLASTNIQVTDNQFSIAKGSTVGAFGASALCSTGGVSWSGNTIHENGDPVAADQDPPY